MRDIMGEYGIVKIIKGKYKGRFAYYDDDDYDDIDLEEYDDDYFDELEPKAVIYLGDLLYNSRYVYIKHDYITNDFTLKDLQDRSLEISRLLWKDLSTKERLLLVEEKSLIDMEIISRYQNFIDSKRDNKVKVFLSHSSIDKNIVVSIALDLEKRGISPWFDAFDILPGESIIFKINEGLNNCDFVLLFLSKNSVVSNWVKKEWESILWDEVNSNKVKIIPIKLDDCVIPKILQTKKYIDLSDDYNRGLFEIVDTINKYSNK